MDTIPTTAPWPHKHPETAGAHSETANFTADDMAKENIHVKILNERLENAQKELEEKDKQLEHYKQLVKTLKDVLADVTARGASAQVNVQNGNNAKPLVKSSSANSKKSIAGRRAKSFNNDYEDHAIGSHLLSDDEEEEKTTISASNSSNSLSGLASSSSHGNLASMAAPMSASTAAIFGFAAPKEDPHAKKVDQHVNVDKVSSWRRPSADLQSVPSRTTTVTQPSNQKSVSIDPSITGSPRGLKKSVSHHAISSLQSDKEANRNPFGDMLGNRPLAPLRPSAGVSTRNNAPASNSNAQKKVEEPKGNALKKSQSMTSVYSAMEESRLDLKFPDLKEMVGQIYALSKYQQGCRFLQKKLDEKNAENTNIIIAELLDHLMELMTDPFGNYLFSKLMEQCDAHQKEQIVTKIIGDLLPTAFDMYGTQSMQKMMPYLTESQVDAVVNALKPSSIALIKHNKANYLIQYCLDNLQQKHNQWIYDAVCECMEDVGRDRVGCVIVKRCVDHANADQMHSLFGEIRNKALALVQDPFGNYVVQHVLDKFPKSEDAQRLIERLVPSVVDLCVQKFSSPVVEKCLNLANDENKHALLAELTTTDNLAQLLNDRFANFVMQTALDVAGPEDRLALVANIMPHLGKHYSPYTKKLQKKILQV